MATVRKYGYYVKGNKVAIVEKDTAFDNDANSRDYGPGSNRSQWKSPLASITDGLELQYVHSPSYLLSASSNSGGVEFRTKTRVGGWFIDTTNYLNFFLISRTLTDDPWNPSDADKGLATDEYILVQNSSKWNGAHKIKSINTGGFIQTYTKSSKKYATGQLSTTGADVNFINASAGNPGGHINAEDASDIWVNLALPVGTYILVLDAGTGDDGLYQVTAIEESDAGAESDQKAYVGKKFFLNAEDDLDEIQSGDDHITADGSISVRRVVFDPCYIDSDLDILDNEEDEIDLPAYLNKALVYYVRAKIAEDSMNLEAKEYFMLQFRKMVEKYNNIKVAGARMQAPGPFAIK